MHFFLRRFWAWSLLLALGLGAAHPLPAAALARTPAIPAAGPHDAFVLLSGGGTPLSNQYSQYLQAEGMSAFLQRRYPPEAVWVFFGAGSRPGQSAAINDVHRAYKRDGLLLSTWLAGALPHNRPATRASVIAALRDEILPRVAPGGTLYLFVGDHGELTRDDPKESAITLWQLEPTKAGGWHTNEAEILTVTDLRGLLAAGLGRGRVVFCMTQCHAGGFNFLGVPRTVFGNPAWYRSGVLPVEAGDWPANLGDTRIAGFTATDEASLAAGCSPDPDPDRWAGYERFVPEAILGTSLMGGAAPARPGAGSFAAAHEAATLVDRTIDKPMGTSDQFLERWADWIDGALAALDDLEPEIARQLSIYSRIVEGAKPAGIDDPLFRARQQRFEKFSRALTDASPATARLLASATKADLVAAIGPGERRPGHPHNRRATTTTKAKTPWTETLRPAWSKAVNAGEVKDVPAAALAFEKFLLQQEAKGADFSSGSQAANSALLNSTYWQSSLAFPSKTDAAKADAVTRWAVERRWRIGEWAKASSDAVVRDAGAKWAPRQRPGLPMSEASGPDRVNRTAVERELFQRRVLGAWAFLLVVDERAALDHLQQLIAVENTPLP